MSKRREINAFNISFLDLISGALGAVIILYVAVPKSKGDGEDALRELIAEQTQKVQILERENNQLKRSQQFLEKENSELKASKLEKKKNSEGGGNDLDVGFRFQGRNIVFAIDTSRSMLKEDRIGQVKAGLKMLITSMPKSFKVDVVIFPMGERAPYKTLWGKIESVSKFKKREIFDFLYDIKPHGATPTRDVLSHILTNYSQISDIVLLTDGEPSLHNSPVKDNIHDLLTYVHQVNINKVQINAIGVGGEVLKDKTSNPYQFLKLIAEQNSGFFVGF